MADLFKGLASFFLITGFIVGGIGLGYNLVLSKRAVTLDEPTSVTVSEIEAKLDKLIELTQEVKELAEEKD